MTTSTKPRLFLIGIGYIGGSLLQSLIASQQYEITALCRGSRKSEVLLKMGVSPLEGSLDDLDVVALDQADIIIHAATADHPASVQRILEVIEKRNPNRTPAVFLHTSGTGVLSDVPCEGLSPSEKIYSDKTNEDMDSLPDSAYHRNVDNLIRYAVASGKLESARVAIIVPPMIFGRGNGPFNQTTIQVPFWIRSAIQQKKVQVIGNGTAIWNHIHIDDLVTAYLTLLTHLKSTSATTPSTNLYYFAETGQHNWLSLGVKIHELLSQKGLVKGEIEFATTASWKGPPGSPYGGNSRSSADNLRGMGWKKHSKQSIEESVVEAVEMVLAETEVAVMSAY